ncbi:MAG: gliding motility-associated C-terminal domain-containing protein [Bacteroidota bacterium]
MRKSTIFKLPKCLLLLLFFTQVCVGQLSNFTLTVTKANETCTANGSLSFTTTGNTAGATMLYAIYLLPNTTTPIATLSGNTYGGLVAGNYRVIATQSLGTQSGTQQMDITILNQIPPLLTYQLAGINSSSCTNNGQITVNVTTGTAVSYEIFAGPIIKPLQPSNVFTGLSAGIYQIRVFDACGEGVVQTYTLATSPSGLQISDQIPSAPSNCSTVEVNHTLSSLGGSMIAYPLTVVLTVFPPSGPPIIYNQVIASGSPTSIPLTQQIALYANQGYSYNLTITDACGNSYSRNNNIANSSTAPSAQVSSMSCNLSQILIMVIQTAVLVTAPVAYTNPLPYNYTPFIVSGTLSILNVPPGIYVFNVTDVCGNPHVLQVTVMPPTVSNPSFLVREGCDANSGSVMISSPNGPMVSIVMVQAPPTYTVPLPQNVSFNLSLSAYTFTMNSLPIGNYKFHLIDTCGNQFDVVLAIQGYQTITNTYAITENCNSFNLELHYASNNNYSSAFWLQEYDSVNNVWEHPLTGMAYVPGSDLTLANAVSLTNNSINTNLAFSGHFRIIMSYKIFGNGVPEALCYKVLNEFDYDGLPKIINVYSFLCSNNTFQVVVNATGLGPLLYRITTKNGLPFVLQNGTSNIFLGLDPAIYNFQVEDVCGNILNSLHDISNPIGFQITPSNFCNGQTASLTVPNFPFLTYQWWEASAPTVILSTTSQLLFPFFNSVNDQGTYFVSIVHLINATCINQIQSYVVNPSQNSPNAGTDGVMSYCGSQGTINLFSLLNGPYDLNGVWSAVTPGGTLTANTWDATGVTLGTYQFKYTVTGFCNVIDEAIVTITLKPIPQTPVATANPTVCATQPLQLFATAVPNATYQWSGPNNFSSSMQNPIITAASAANSGVYSVQTLLNGCISGSSSVTVQVVPLPNAGSNSTMSYCGSQNTIDLFTLLNGNYDANGVWSTLSTSGILTNNMWNATGVGPGVYQFTHTVTGSCATPVSAIVTITLQPIPQVPIASVNPVVCDASQLQLFATSIPNATYQWSGPNGFTSGVQNPIINTVSALNNGTYTVSALQNGCPSGSSSVIVQVAPTPEFAIEFNCIDNVAVLSATPIQNSFDAATALYQWTNTDGFSSSANPVTITGEAVGTYTLTVTNTDGCFTTNTIDVAATLCAIPIGISPNNDGLNDSFDLSGFSDITSVKIFNRYGMVVFEQDNYVNEWMGQDKKGRQLPSATYFYLVNFESTGPRTGWVYLMRENN